MTEKNILIYLMIFAALTVLVHGIKIIYKIRKKIKKKLIIKRRKSKKKKSAKELAMMTPKERQEAFFNACWEEIEKHRKRK